MYLRKLFYLLLILPILFVGCSDEDDPVTTEEGVNESEVLAKYLEDNGDFINTYAPAMITADAVKGMVGDPAQVVIDIRAAADFAIGHIPGAVNVTLKDVVDYYENNNLSSKSVVVIACYSGQTAGYATSLLRMKGYSNVKDLKWGMNSWNDELSKSWSNNIGNNFTGFVTTATAKNVAGDLPTLSTGKTTGEEILDARIDAMLGAADPFGDVKISYSSVTANPSDYYIVNYWSQAHYDLGHIPGAIQYTPKESFKLATDLNTLPTDKTIVVYCYTGQTSAHVAAFLKALGYDAKSLLFGVNTMNYDWMLTHDMTHFDGHYIMGYDYETGN
ncbi:MAG: hypothetical protein SCALA702_07530 [Melioribacteraceae bacterium]|nr:MAG: hypothetical protein SCALA702_07530 [Melioribacteraceae bacterium]